MTTENAADYIINGYYDAIIAMVTHVKSPPKERAFYALKSQ